MSHAPCARGSHGAYARTLNVALRNRVRGRQRPSRRRVPQHMWSYWFFSVNLALLRAWVRTVFPESIGDDFA